MQLAGNVTVDDVRRMESKLFITVGPERPAKWSAFWVLLVLSAVIATAGVISDSTATVIGAMIVAPLMTPILGTALALVLAERRPLVGSIGLVLAGAVLVVTVGFLIGLTHVGDVTAATNSQVAGRVSPRLIDLVAALATGAVGAFALVRSDISDTIPGVAIAISLVPPLAVVGLTLESGAPDEAMGALLLFATNVAAIVATGTLVLLLFGVRGIVAVAGRPVGAMSKRTLGVVIGAVGLVAVPLLVGSVTAAQDQIVVQRATPVVESWAIAQGWIASSVTVRQGELRIIAVGPPPEADLAALRRNLDAAGLAGERARVTLVIGGTRELPPG